MTLLNLLKEIENSETIAALSWTLFHSLWQGLLFALMAGFVLLSTKRTKPAIRYNVLVVLLLTQLLTSVFTFWYENALLHWQTGRLKLHLQLLSKHDLYNHLSDVSDSRLFFGQILGRLSDYIFQYAGEIALIWMIVIVFKTAKLIFALQYSRYICKYRSAEAPVVWKEKLAKHCVQLSINRHVFLLESALIKIPVVYGWFKPMIFFPLGLLSNLPPEQIEAILLHELAHIRRNDYRVNLLQNIVDWIFFFNPAILWLSARIREEREHCCDDLAIMHMADRKNLVEALINFKELSLGENSLARWALLMEEAFYFTGSITLLASRTIP